MKIAIIRIKGPIKVNREMNKTMYMLRLRRKNVCVVVEDTKQNLGMIKKIKDYVTYGEIDEETLKLLKEKRGIKNKVFFRLHPPRGGFKKTTKLLWPKGILGNQGKEINKLIKKML